MNKFKELRKKFGFTQNDLADKIHINQSAISKWEKNKTTPDIQTLTLLSKLYNVSIDYLLGNDDLQTPPPDNEVIIYGRNRGKKKYKLTPKQIDAIQNILDTYEDQNDF